MADATTQAKPPTKDTRLVVRLEAEDLNFVREEGEKLSLDASTWVRMMIRKLRLGQIGEHQAQPTIGLTLENAPMPPHRPAVNGAAEPLPDHGYFTSKHGEVADETLDTDDLVARKMAEADQKGLTQPRAAQDDADMGDEFEDFTGGIRPVGDRQIWNTGKPKDFRPE